MTIHDEIYKIIAKDKRITLDVIEAVCRSQSEFVTLQMEQASYEDGGKSVRLPFFGIFRVKPVRLQKLRENKLRREAETFSQLEDLKVNNDEETNNISKE